MYPVLIRICNFVTKVLYLSATAAGLWIIGKLGLPIVLETADPKKLQSQVFLISFTVALVTGAILLYAFLSHVSHKATVPRKK